MTYFGPTPEQSLLHGADSARQVGTVVIDGVECRRLIISRQEGIEVELWVENNPSAIPHRLTLTDQGTLSFTAEFTRWNNHADPTDQASVLLKRADTQ